MRVRRRRLRAARAPAVLVAACSTPSRSTSPASRSLLLGAGRAAWVGAGARGVRVQRTLAARRVVEDEPLACASRARPAGCRCRPAGSTSRCWRAGALPSGRRSARSAIEATFAGAGAACSSRRASSCATRSAWPARRRRRRADEVLVLPRIEAVRVARPAGATATPRARAPLLVAAAETEIDGLRRYREGTPASRIHWPALARGAGLMERRLRADADTRPLVVLDPRAPARRTSTPRCARRRRWRCSSRARGAARCCCPATAAPHVDRPAWPAGPRRTSGSRSSTAATRPGLARRAGRSGPVVYVAARPARPPPRAGSSGRRAAGSWWCPGAAGRRAVPGRGLRGLVGAAARRAAAREAASGSRRVSAATAPAQAGAARRDARARRRGRARAGVRARWRVRRAALARCCSPAAPGRDGARRSRSALAARGATRRGCSRAGGALRRGRVALVALLALALLARRRRRELLDPRAGASWPPGIGGGSARCPACACPTAAPTSGRDRHPRSAARCSRCLAALPRSGRGARRAASRAALALRVALRDPRHRARLDARTCAARVLALLWSPFLWLAPARRRRRRRRACSPSASRWSALALAPALDRDRPVVDYEKLRCEHRAAKRPVRLGPQLRAAGLAARRPRGAARQGRGAPAYWKAENLDASTARAGRATRLATSTARLRRPTAARPRRGRRAIRVSGRQCAPTVIGRRRRSSSTLAARSRQVPARAGGTWHGPRPLHRGDAYRAASTCRGRPRPARARPARTTRDAARAITELILLARRRTGRPARRVRVDVPALRLHGPPVAPRPPSQRAETATGA